jgi:hypothetical protein
MNELAGNRKRAGWANTIRSKTMANLDTLAAELNDKGKEAVAIAREDLLTHTDAEWWIENNEELKTPAGVFDVLSDTAKAAIDALRG